MIDFLGQSIEQLREESKGCRMCPLWEHATQTVFGEGPPTARLVMVGEQPGDKEDLAGEPFVGPAGRLLRTCMAEAGIDESEAYITNAVKHFKWEAKGARRIHKRPNYREVQACYPWLQAEIAAINPELVILLGSTAGQALLGKDYKVTEMRGKFYKLPSGLSIFPTIHPSALLRVFDHHEKEAAIKTFTEELRLAAEILAKAELKRSAKLL